MPPGDTVVRLVTKAGRSRLTLPAGATLADLQEQVRAHASVEPAAQRLALDPAGRQIITGGQDDQLARCGITNGTQVHLINADASIEAQVLKKEPIRLPPEEAGKEAEPAAPAASSSSSAGGRAGGGSAPSGGGPQALPDDKDDGKLKLNPKFKTFDAFLQNRRFDTASLPGAQKFQSVKLQKGVQTKLPLAVSIKQQPFRHVDMLSVMNPPEMQNFVNYWQVGLEMTTQRAGWMYGYYVEDTNYEEGTRAVMEGIYEPPQVPVETGVQLLDDPKKALIDRIADRLGLEPIGYVFTSLPIDEGELVTSHEALRAARLQLQHTTDIHFTKYPLSKFVTCAIRPDASLGGRPNTTALMMSDQLVCMVRDNVLAEGSDAKFCEVRPAAPGEMMPRFLVEGKDNTQIMPAFFVVRVADSMPRKTKSLFKHADFPRENRHPPQRRDDLKKYFNKRTSSEPSWSRFADFHLILYLAQEFDVDTALDICDCVRERKDISPGVVEMVKALLA